MPLLTCIRRLRRRRVGPSAPRSGAPNRPRPRLTVEQLDARIVPAAVGTPVQNFVDQVYRDFAGRPPSPAELATGEAALERGLTRMQFVLAVEQLPDYRAREVTRYFGRIMERSPSPDELNTGVTFLQKGGTINQYVASLISDPSYFRRNGNNTDRFVRDVFEDLLQANNASPNDVHQRAERDWLHLLHSGQANRAEFIRLITTGLPFRIQLVQDHSQDLLGQTATDASVRILAAVEFRRGDDRTAALIASSDAYFVRAQQTLVVQQRQAPPAFSDTDSAFDAASEPNGDIDGDTV